MRDFTQMLAQLEANNQLVFSYFAGFSRFEFALIQSRVFLNPQKANQHHPTADWISFAEAIESHFDFERTSELIEAVAYLENQPPNRQSIVNGSILWVVNDDVENKTRLGRLAVHVKTIRNNLFHGGKYPNAPAIPAERDTNLLKSGIVMLEEFLIQSAPHLPDVRRYFDLTVPDSIP